MRKLNIGLGYSEKWWSLLQCKYSRLGLAGHWITLLKALLPTEGWTRWSPDVPLNPDFSTTLIWKTESGTSSSPILFSFVKLFFLLIILKIVLWLHLNAFWWSMYVFQFGSGIWILIKVYGRKKNNEENKYIFPWWKPWVSLWYFISCYFIISNDIWDQTKTW